MHSSGMNAVKSCVIMVESLVFSWVVAPMVAQELALWTFTEGQFKTQKTSFVSLGQHECFPCRHWWACSKPLGDLRYNSFITNFTHHDVTCAVVGTLPVKNARVHRSGNDSIAACI